MDGRKLSALKFWDLIAEDDDGKMKLTPNGREIIKGDEKRIIVLREIIKKIPAYFAIIERAAHRNEDSLSTTEVAAHWYEHFKSEVAETDKVIKDQAVCFFHIAAGANLGTIIPGRKGNPTRFSFAIKELKNLIGTTIEDNSVETPTTVIEESTEVKKEVPSDKSEDKTDQNLGQGIFVAHGKNKKPLDQLKKILDQFKIPYKVAIEEPNLGRPISSKVREVMQACNCAILIFTADEEFTDKNGNKIYRPSENVVYELGASGYLYDQRIVIMKEEGVDFPANFRDIGYISFEKDELDAKTMDVLKELIGFGIVKVSV